MTNNLEALIIALVKKEYWITRSGPDCITIIAPEMDVLEEQGEPEE